MFNLFVSLSHLIQKYELQIAICFKIILIYFMNLTNLNINSKFICILISLLIHINFLGFFAYILYRKYMYS